MSNRSFPFLHMLATTQQPWRRHCLICQVAALARPKGADESLDDDLSLLLYGAAKAISQICNASPDSYLNDAELLETLATATITCLDAVPDTSSDEQVRATKRLLHVRMGLSVWHACKCHPV